MEANALKDGEIRVAEYKSELRRQVGTVRMEFDESLVKLRTWTTEKLQTEIQALEGIHFHLQHQKVQRQETN